MRWGIAAGAVLMAASFGATPSLAQPVGYASYWWAARPLTGEPDNPESRGFAIVILDKNTPAQNRRLCEFFQLSPAFYEPFDPVYEVSGRRYFRRPVYWPLKSDPSAQLGQNPTCEELQASYDYGTYALFQSVLDRPGQGPFIAVFSSKQDKDLEKPKYRALFDFSELSPEEIDQNLKGFQSYIRQDQRRWSYNRIFSLSLAQRARRFPAKVGAVFTDLFPWGK